MTRRYWIIRIVAVIVLTLLLSAVAGHIPLPQHAGEVISGLAHSLGSNGVEDTMDLYMAGVTLAALALSVILVFTVDRLLRYRR